MKKLLIVLLITFSANSQIISDFPSKDGNIVFEGNSIDHKEAELFFAENFNSNVVLLNDGSKIIGRGSSRFVLQGAAVCWLNFTVTIENGIYKIHKLTIQSGGMENPAEDWFSQDVYFKKGKPRKIYSECKDKVLSVISEIQKKISK